MKPLLISHRGDTTNFSENTLDAFKSAFSHGADGVEFDIHFYKGDWIVVHDYLFSENQKYPLLKNVLEELKNKGRLEIEVKGFEDNGLNKLEQILTPYKNQNIEITTSVLPLLPYLTKKFNHFKIGLIFKENLFEEWMNEDLIIRLILGYLKLAKGNIAHLPERILSKKLINSLHKNGYKIHVNIPNTKNQKQMLIRLTDLGVNQFTINDIRVVTFLV